MRRLTIVIVLISLCGCETVRKLTSTPVRPEEPPQVNFRETWIGKNADKLMEVWGIPTQEYNLKNGSRLVSYQKVGGSKTVVVPGSIVGVARTDTYRCDTTFTVDEKNIVQHVSWEGNGC